MCIPPPGGQTLCRLGLLARCTSGEASSGGADANPPPFGQKFDFVCLVKIVKIKIAKIVINGGAFRGTSQR